MIKEPNQNSELIAEMQCFISIQKDRELKGWRYALEDWLERARETTGLTDFETVIWMEKKEKSE